MKYYILFLLLLLLLNCQKEQHSESILTVNGSISPDEMGTTLIHEHIMVDWIGADSTGYHRWDRDSVVARALPFLIEAKLKGMNTLFDCTPAYLGRDPYILKALSDSTGINIITNTGFYGARNNQHIPPFAFESTAEEIAQIWIKEFNQGIDDSGVKPGFIKMSVEGDSLSDFHAKLVEAAAITHKETDLTIVSHTGPDHLAFAQLEILKSKGINPENFVWTHAQNGTLEGHIKAANEGAWISLDHVSSDSTRLNWYVDHLSKIKNEGLFHRVLISHDSGWYNVGQVKGGIFNSYTAIFDHLVPELLKNGFVEEDIHQLIIINPKEAFNISL